jgi:hypothetical protein
MWPSESPDEALREGEEKRVELMRVETIAFCHDATPYSFLRCSFRHRREEDQDLHIHLEKTPCSDQGNEDPVESIRKALAITQFLLRLIYRGLQTKKCSSLITTRLEMSQAEVMEL